MPIFTPFTFSNLTLRNRIVMSPMCMNSSDDSGTVQEFHRIHYGTRAYGGAGLILLEATAVEGAGRITNRDLGIWNEQQAEGLASLVKTIHEGGAKAGVQLAHAGRKCTVDYEQSVAPSSFHFSADYRTPEELTQDGIDRCIERFKQAARRAYAAEFDAIEIHAAHGYLIHEFLSPLSNRRTDQYNGSTDNRLRFLREIIQAVRQVWPAEKPLLVRLSASDYLPGGLNIDETIRLVNGIKADVDLFDISSGGLLPTPIEETTGYQVDFAAAIRQKAQVPVMAVGLITTREQSEKIVADGQADLVALGRELLRNPYWPIIFDAQRNAQSHLIPKPYRRAFAEAYPK